MLKEGPAEDFANREKILGLLRFASTHTGNSEQTVSLDDYIERMKEGQDKIYYITAENYNAAANSPHLEIFRKKGVEVVLMYDRIDEWMMGQIFDYKGKSFINIAKGDLDLGDIESEEEKKQQEEVEKSSEDLIKRLKGALETKVSEVKVSHRLTDSPACLVVGAYDLGIQMRQIMEAAGQKMPDSKPTLEINPGHPLMERLSAEVQEDRFNDLANVVYDQAALTEGRGLDDPAAYVKRINALLMEALK